MAGIPLRYGSAPGGQQGLTRLSTFVKFATLPTVRTCIVDGNGGATGYHRISYDPTNKFVGETAYLGNVTTINLCPSFTVNTNAWYWVSICNCSTGVWENLDLIGQVWGPGGVTPGQQHAVTFIGQSSAVVSSGVGWGVALTAYANFPDTAGNELAELVVEENQGGPASNIGPLGPPAGALSPSSTIYIVGLYHCTEAIGSGVIVHDATTNHYDMAAGPQGNAIVSDSPF